MPPHPTFFTRKSFYERLGGFDPSMGTAADYELMLRFLLKHGVRTAYIPRVLVLMQVGGASNRSLAGRIRANRMDRRAWTVNGLSPRPWTLICKPLGKVGQYFARPPGQGR
jgi:glycosyltransferase